MNARRAPQLLPRSTPAASEVSSRAIAALLDRLDAQETVELHSIMIVRRGHVLAEGWWAPYCAERPHLLYSLTKSFTAIAVGLAIEDGLLALNDRIVDVLPDHVPADASDQARRITVHHLLSMTTGHLVDSLAEAWELEPADLVSGFLRLKFDVPEGTRHTYDNSTTFILARMVERVTGQGLPEYLDERLFKPMGVAHPEWDRVAGGAAFGFHGLHLTTEAVAAFGELLRRGGVWRDGRRLVPRDWVDLATSRQIDCTPFKDDGSDDADFSCGYGYQFWMSRHGYHGHGAYGQQCVVIPEHDLVIAVTAQGESQRVFDALWECLLPGVDHPDTASDDDLLAERLRQLSLPTLPGTPDPGRSARAILDASPPDSALPAGTTVTVDPVDGGGWRIRFGAHFTIEAGYGTWRESFPLGRSVLAIGAWHSDTFTADLFVINSPHRVRLVVEADTETATATWSTPPLTGPNLTLHLTSPLMTRPDVS